MRRATSISPTVRITPSGRSMLTVLSPPSAERPRWAVTTGTAAAKAGSAGTVSCAGNEIDKTAPSVTIASLSADATAYAANTWTNQTVALHFTRSDTLSGVAACPADQVFSVAGVSANVSGTA